MALESSEKHFYIGSRDKMSQGPAQEEVGTLAS